MNLVLLLASLASGIIQGVPKLSSTIKTTIAAIVQGLSGVIASGVTNAPSEATILAALSGVIAAAKADPALAGDSATLALISGLEDAIAAALNEDKIASTAVDPSALSPISTLPTPVAGQ